jgi:hypothetical protein
MDRNVVIIQWILIDIEQLLGIIFFFKCDFILFKLSFDILISHLT